MRGRGAHALLKTHHGINSMRRNQHPVPSVCVSVRVSQSQWQRSPPNPLLSSTPVVIMVGRLAGRRVFIAVGLSLRKSQFSRSHAFLLFFSFLSRQKKNGQRQSATHTLSRKHSTIFFCGYIQNIGMATLLGAFRQCLVEERTGTEQLRPRF
jgi:hypothetical protein